MLNDINLLLQIISIGFLLLAIVLIAIVIFRDKSIFVKLLVLEVLVNVFICGVAIYALIISFALLLDICIALSLIAFLSTAAYCQYIAKQRRN
jgi:multicomponent Na+:H+ antiporter subunit F